MSDEFVVHVGDLRKGGGPPRELRVEVSVDWHAEMSRILPDPPLRVDFELYGVAGGVVVMGSITATAVHRCYRCLEERAEALVLDVKQVLVEAGDADDDYRLVGDTFDLESVVRDEVLLALPVAPVCESNCAGLVAAAGTDLNTEPPDTEEGAASPFAVLKDLLDNEG